MERADVLIVGAGHGGAQAAAALRENGFQGSVMMVGREPDMPYERPPLSKEYLAREKDFDRILIRTAQFWEDKQITMLLGTEVIGIDPAAKVATLSSGRTIGYGFLIWATGGDPRRLSCAGAELVGVHAVRTREDADRLMHQLDGGARRVVVIGGGYIGLEAAAVLTKLGCSVVLLEALPRVLARVAGEALSAFYQAEHRAHGVDLRTGSSVECIEGDGTKVTGVRLHDGEVIGADLVIVGIGVVPCVAPLIAAGATGRNGVDVDNFCRSSLPDVYAIGDCAAHANRFADHETIRLESVQNAVDMATTAAKSICGLVVPYEATPWFWSNQYDLRLQTVGLSTGHDEAILRGSPASRSFSVIYRRRGMVVALDCVNMVKDYVQGRRLVESRAQVDRGALEDIYHPLKEL